VQLLVDRAQAVKPDFQVTANNRTVLIELCQRLEGHPLALELVAARAQTLTPGQMLERLSERFALLVDRWADEGMRHRSVWAAIQWSYELLGPATRAFFARAALFRGGWTVESAREVCRDESALDLISQLESHSLLMGEHRAGSVRFRMLDTVREFAVEQLDDEDLIETSRRHAEHFRDLARSADLELTGPEQADWLQRLEAEHDNLRAALEWSSEHEPVAALEMAGLLNRLWMIHGHFAEGRNRLTTALKAARANAPPALVARALHGVGLMSHYLCDCDRAIESYRECVALRRSIGDEEGAALTLGNIGLVAADQGRIEAAEQDYRAALEILESTGNRLGAANAYHNLANLCIARGALPEARAYQQKALAIYTELGDTRGICQSFGQAAGVLLLQSEPESADAAAARALELASEIADPMVTAIASGIYGLIKIAVGDQRAAHSQVRTSLLEARATGSGASIALALSFAASVAATSGEYARAARLFGAADRIHERVRVKASPTEGFLFSRYRDAVTASLGEVRANLEHARGHRLSPDEAFDYALEDQPHD
jgi:tetratricopeptide (TPR) repeat protein